MSDSPSQYRGTSTDVPERSGKVFVILTAVFLALLVIFLLVVSPRLQDGLGLNDGRGFDPPSDGVMTVPLLLGDVEFGQVVWDGSGICAEITDSTGTTFRTCAVPDPLRPIWAIDAPDEAAEPYLLIATPPDVVNLEGATTDGETFGVLTQARQLPAAWAVVRLPEGAVVDKLFAFNASNSDVGGAQCGVEDAPTNGPDRLAGGCLVPQED